MAKFGIHVLQGLLVCLLLACGKPPEQQADPTAAGENGQAEVNGEVMSENMRRSFILPDRVQEAAPEMQAHLYKLLRYTSPRFIVKPEFVFLDMDREVRGQSHPHVVHMNLLHLAYWKQERLSWSGSLLLGDRRGWMGFAERGLQVKMAFIDDSYQLLFVDGDQRVEAKVAPDQNSERWLELPSGRLFVYYYNLPKVKRAFNLPSGKSAPSKNQ